MVKPKWFKNNEPRWVVIQWLCFRSRLATKDGLSKWNLVSDAESVLSTQAAESIGTSVLHVSILFVFGNLFSRKKKLFLGTL